MRCATAFLSVSTPLTRYETILTHRGVEPRFYRLQPERNWEADVKHMRSLCDANTAAILVNNPSNPCGSNYSEAHLRDIIAFADEKRLPIIVDEIYADMVFEGQRFVPLASLSKRVPVISVGGTAKRFMVPGWRLGWVRSCAALCVVFCGVVR